MGVVYRASHAMLRRALLPLLVVLACPPAAAAQHGPDTFTATAAVTRGDVTINVGGELSVLVSAEDNIVPLLVGCPVKAKRISDILLAEYGLYVQPINFPTVPRGTERLRFTPGPCHTAEMMDVLTDALVEIWGRLELQAVKAA